MAEPKEPKAKQSFPPDAVTREYAESLDAADPLRAFRDKFIIPSKENLKTKKLAKPGLLTNAKETSRPDTDCIFFSSFFTGLSPEPCIYFCGNSLGLQPRATSQYMEAYLDTWSSIGVIGHFRDLEDSPLKQWQLLSEQAAEQMSRLVGAKPAEVAVMGTLTMNLHLMLASFYTPSQTKHKILLDWKAFPSDHVGQSSR